MLMAQTLNGYSFPERRPEMYVKFCNNIVLPEYYYSIHSVCVITFYEQILCYAAQALYIGVKITEAVHYMHTHDPIIIHQDIKPHNVLVRIQHIVMLVQLL